MTRIILKNERFPLAISAPAQAEIETKRPLVVDVADDGAYKYALHLSNEGFALHISELERQQLEYIAHRIMLLLGGSIVYPPSDTDRAYFEQDGDYRISSY